MSEAAKDSAVKDSAVLAYADSLGQNQPPEEESEATEAWVSFRLSSNAFAFPVETVQEVLRVGSITRVPQAAPGVRGVTNMRGRVLPVLDLAARLDLKAREIDERSRILVVPGASGPVGLLVDQVEQMLSLAPSTFQEPPDRLDAIAHFALGVVTMEEDLLVLLDLGPVLDFDKN